MALNVVCCGNPNWEKVTVFHEGKKQEIEYTMDKSNGDLYWSNGLVEVAIKCAAVFIFTPLFTACVMYWFGASAIVDILEPSKMLHDIWQVARAPIYGFAVMATSSLFVIDPYLARKQEAIVEKNWQNDVSYRDDWRKKYKLDLSCWENVKYGIANAQASYFAWCFQVRGNINDANKKLIRREKVSL